MGYIFRKNKKRIKILCIIVFIIIVSNSVYGVIKPLPKGISVEGEAYEVSNVDFLYDLTYKKDGKKMQEQAIFDKVFKLISNAEKFIVIDMFLFNNDYDRKDSYPEISLKLANALIIQKQKYPELKITFITDEMNTFYGSYMPKNLEMLKNNGCNVVLTNLNKLRDSNPVYSGVWRTFFQWFKTSDKGWLRNPFSPDSPKVTLRSYMKLLNLKANHRKLIVTEKKALISSANPHDASANHSNIAFLIDGPIMKDIIASEKAVANFSGSDITDLYTKSEKLKGNIKVSLLTEGKIRKNLLEEIEKTISGDKIEIGMFYMSERNIIKELIKASKRGVNIKIILDSNKDAFGMEKNGIPNRPVAYELSNKSNKEIKIRWYDTNGEQFHTKLIKITNKNESIIFGGSANLTRRNIGDYNLEADLKIQAPNDSKVAVDIEKYFDRLWNNRDGNYTVALEKFYKKSFFKTIIYRFQEWSGLSSF